MIYIALYHGVVDEFYILEADNVDAAYELATRDNDHINRGRLGVSICEFKPVKHSEDFTWDEILNTWDISGTPEENLALLERAETIDIMLVELVKHRNELLNDFRINYRSGQLDARDIVGYASKLHKLQVEIKHLGMLVRTGDI